MHLLVQTALAGAVLSSTLGQGMRVSLRDFTLLRREPTLVLRSLLLAWVIPVLVTVPVLICLEPPHATVVGLTLAAVCPAPALLFSGALAVGGRPAYAATLQRLLSISAVLVLPFLLKLAAHLLGFSARIGSLAVMRQVAWAVLLPTTVGILLRRLLPGVSSWLQPKLSAFGTHAYMLVGGLVLLQAYPTLTTFGWRSYASVLVLMMVSLFLGQFWSPARGDDSRAFALACANRNTGLAFLIASINYPSQAAMYHLIPYLVISTACTTAYEHWFRHTNRGSTRKRSWHRLLPPRFVRPCRSQANEAGTA